MLNDPYTINNSIIMIIYVFTTLCCKVQTIIYCDDENYSC